MSLVVLPYYIFLALVMLVYRSRPKTKEHDRISISEIVTACILVLFAGLRDETVGTDTMGYVRSFDEIYSKNLSDEVSEMLLQEPGFYFLKLFSHIFSDNYAAFLCTISALCYGLVMIAIHKHSENRALSLFVYITLGYYTFCFNAARQALALSVYLLALPCILNRNLIRYCILVAVAALFHRTVLIALPLYFMFTMKYSWKSVLLTITVAVLTSVMLPSLIDSASTIEARYAYYSNAEAKGGYMLTAFYVMLALFFVFMRGHVPKKERKEYDIYLQMLICGSVIYLVVSLSGAYVELTRFAAYFQVASIFLFAMVYNAKKHLIPQPFMAAIRVGCLIFFYIFLTSMADLVPYSFNSTL